MNANNVTRFTARTAREALNLVKKAFGDDAVVLSTKPCPEGVEVLAMAPEGMAHIEKLSNTAPKVSAPAVPAKGASPATRKPGSRLADRVEPEAAATPVDDDVKRLSMSTLSFQDFVRERMLRRRQEAMSEASRFPDDAVDIPLMGSHQDVPLPPIYGPTADAPM